MSPIAPFFALVVASVLNAASSASLGSNTDPFLTSTGKPKIGCDDICKAFGAQDGCSYEMETRAMSKELSKVMLAKHNQLRRKLAKGEEESWPSAANMMKLVWSEELASSAQEQADQCNTNGTYDVPGATFGRTWRLSDHGSNITMTMEDFEKIVDSWYSLTVDGFGNSTIPFGQNQPDISAAAVAKSGPFWDETKAMGCGLVIFSRENWRMLELSCSYDSPSVGAPTHSDPLYEEGPPCSSCQPGFSCDDGLCASNNTEVTTTESGCTESSSTNGESTDVSGHTGTGSTSEWEN